MKLPGRDQAHFSFRPVLRQQTRVDPPAPAWLSDGSRPRRKPVPGPQRSTKTTAEPCAQVHPAAAEHRRHIHPAGNGQETPATPPRFTNPERGAGGDPQWLPTGHAREFPAADRDPGLPLEAQLRSAERELNPRRCLGISHEQVRHPRREFIRRTSRPHPGGTPAFATKILYRGKESRLQDADHRFSRRHFRSGRIWKIRRSGRCEAHLVSRAQQRRLGTMHVKQPHRRTADEVPAAGRRTRIRTGLRAADPDRAGRHQGPWRGTARAREFGRQSR